MTRVNTVSITEAAIREITGRKEEEEEVAVVEPVNCGALEALEANVIEQSGSISLIAGAGICLVNFKLMPPIQRPEKIHMTMAMNMTWL